MSAIGSLVAATAMPFIRQTFSEADTVRYGGWVRGRRRKEKGKEGMMGRGRGGEGDGREGKEREGMVKGGKMGKRGCD